MNRLVIIGNGFDLAHGLQTRYSDFLNDYLSNIFFCSQKSKGTDYKGELLKINKIPPSYSGFNLNEFLISIKEKLLNKYVSSNTLSGINLTYENFEYSLKSDFFGFILLKSVENWIDFENLYFQFLNELFNLNESNNSKIEKLNTDFNIIKIELENYLEQNTKFNREEFKFNNYKTEFRKFFIEKNFDSILNPLSEKRNFIDGNLLVLNFNYTRTIDFHTDEISIPKTVINIHGELKSNLNPIIFGYGDYFHSDYSKMENSNNNELLKNLKSMHYPKTDNQKRLNHFLDTGQINSTDSQNNSLFEVVVLGHSCGLSDRNLLRTIFQHKNCAKIYIAYFQDNEDHFNKTIEVSRHFEKKEVMLSKLESLNPKLKTPQLVDYMV